MLPALGKAEADRLARTGRGECAVGRRWQILSGGSGWRLVGFAWSGSTGGCGAGGRAGMPDGRLVETLAGNFLKEQGKDSPRLGRGAVVA